MTLVDWFTFGCSMFTVAFVVVNVAACAIRSTLPTPAARAGDDEKENTKT